MEKNFVQGLVNMRDDRVTFRKNDGRSDVWDSFLKVEIDASFSGYVMCIKCNTILKWKSSDGTSGLRTHKSTCKVGSEKMSEPVDIHFVTTTTFKKSVENPNEVSMASLGRNALADEIVRMCAKDLIPLDIVDCEGFQELASKLVSLGALYGPIEAQAILPNKVSVERHLQFMAEEGRHKLAIILQKILKFGVTVDIWVHKQSSETFVTIRVHYIDSSWCLQSPILMTRAIDKDQNPDYICMSVREILEQFNAYRYDNTFITDDVVNLKSAFKDNTWIGCCNYNIGVIINQALNIENTSSLQCVASLVSTCRNIISHISKLRAFRHLDIQLKRTGLEHWNDILEMMKSVDVNIVQLKNIALEIEDKMLKRLLSALNETLLHDVIKVLEVFQQASHILSSSDGPTIHLVVATKCKLIKCTQPSASNSDVIINLKKKILELIDCHFHIHRICYVALLLDPRLKNNKTVWTNEDKDSALQHLRDLLKVKLEVLGKDEFSHKTDPEICDVDSTLESQPKKIKVDFLDEIFLEGSKTMVDEVDEYMSNRTTSDDILQFWRENERRFPNLSRIARGILSIPATNSLSKGSIAAFPDWANNWRINLNPDCIDDLLFLHKLKVY